MSLWHTIISNLPEVEGPTQKTLSFREKLKWTGIVLSIFFILGLIPLFGLGVNALQNFETLSLILGAEFGSIISLGIGPIVTASIVLQLLNGSGISLFIAADVSKSLFLQAFNWIVPTGSIYPRGAIPTFVISIVNGEIT